MYGSSRNMCERVVEISDYNCENEHPDFGKPKHRIKRGRRYDKTTFVVQSVYCNLHIKRYHNSITT